MSPRPTQTLAAEHRLIEGVLDALERAVAEAERTRVLPAAFIEDVVLFSRVFVDRCHHGKEERCFFPCLVNLGLPADGGPIEIMLREHEEGRRLALAIADGLARYQHGSAALEDVLGICRDYVDLLRTHIEKETHVLFPLGDELAGEDEDEGARRCFEEIEASLGAAGRDVLTRLTTMSAHPGRTP